MPAQSRDPCSLYFTRFVRRTERRRYCPSLSLSVLRIVDVYAAISIVAFPINCSHSSPYLLRNEGFYSRKSGKIYSNLLKIELAYAQSLVKSIILICTLVTYFYLSFFRFVKSFLFHVSRIYRIVNGSKCLLGSAIDDCLAVDMSFTYDHYARSLVTSDESLVYYLVN